MEREQWDPGHDVPEAGGARGAVDATPATGAPLLGPDDPPPFEVFNPEGRARVVFLCDHASNRVPRALDHLGLPPAELERHIAWDIGAAALTRRLARHFDAPAVLAGYSRLVIDCNRPLDDEQSILPLSDGTTIPGNRGLTAEAAAGRAAACFHPYHRACAAVLDATEARGAPSATSPAPFSAQSAPSAESVPSAPSAQSAPSAESVPSAPSAIPAPSAPSAPSAPVIMLHSFTPHMNGALRPWHAGVLWDEDGRMALPLLRALRARDGLHVGDNEPYSGASPHGYTMPTHAARHGRANVQIEVRQDLVADEAGIDRWSAILIEALAEVFADPTLYARKRDTRREALRHVENQA